MHEFTGDWLEIKTKELKIQNKFTIRFRLVMLISVK